MGVHTPYLIKQCMMTLGLAAWSSGPLPLELGERCGKAIAQSAPSQILPKHVGRAPADPARGAGGACGCRVLCPLFIDGFAGGAGCAVGAAQGARNDRLPSADHRELQD
eukprot:8683132-Alexandrium_andersonii.AAC.1